MNKEKTAINKILILYVSSFLLRILFIYKNICVYDLVEVQFSLPMSLVSNKIIKWYTKFQGDNIAPFTASTALFTPIQFSVAKYIF